MSIIKFIFQQFSLHT